MKSITFHSNLQMIIFCPQDNEKTLFKLGGQQKLLVSLQKQNSKCRETFTIQKYQRWFEDISCVYDYEINGKV